MNQLLKTLLVILLFLFFSCRPKKRFTKNCASKLKYLLEKKMSKIACFEKSESSLLKALPVYNFRSSSISGISKLGIYTSVSSVVEI